LPQLQRCHDASAVTPVLKSPRESGKTYGCSENDHGCMLVADHRAVAIGADGRRPQMRNVVGVVLSTALCCFIAIGDGSVARAEHPDFVFFHNWHRHHQHDYHYHRHSFREPRHNYHWQNWESYRSQYRGSRNERNPTHR
jgi:hypothetical protein